MGVVPIIPRFFPFCSADHFQIDCCCRKIQIGLLPINILPAVASSSLNDIIIAIISSRRHLPICYILCCRDSISCGHIGYTFPVVAISAVLVPGVQVQSGLRTELTYYLLCRMQSKHTTVTSSLAYKQK